MTVFSVMRGLVKIGLCGFGGGEQKYTLKNFIEKELIQVVNFKWEDRTKYFIYLQAISLAS